MRLSVYALGGGMGHVTRSLAISRAVVRAGHEVRVLANSADAELLLSAARKDSCSNLATAAASFDLLSSQLTVEQTRRQALAWLANEWDGLLVDTFPRGLGGELADFVTKEERPLFLVHRDLNPRYVTSRDLRSIATAYERILLPGESGPLSDLANAVPTEPWLICDAGDLHDRVVARAAFRAPEQDRPVIVVVGSGRAEEVSDAVTIASRLREALGDTAYVRFASLETAPGKLADITVRLWPLMRYLRGVDVLIGAGGYNTVNEARATKTRLFAIPRGRLYDRQDQRLTDEERTSTVEELIVSVTSFVGKGVLQEDLQASMRLENGVHTALREIESVLSLR